MFYPVMQHLTRFQLSDYLPHLHGFPNQLMLSNKENETLRPQLIASET